MQRLQTPPETANELAANLKAATFRSCNSPIEDLLAAGGDILICGRDTTEFAIRLSDWLRRFTVSARIIDAHDYLQLRRMKRPARVILVPVSRDFPKKLLAHVESAADIILEVASDTEAKITKGGRGRILKRLVLDGAAA